MYCSLYPYNYDKYVCIFVLFHRLVGSRLVSCENVIRSLHDKYHEQVIALVSFIYNLIGFTLLFYYHFNKYLY